MASPVSSRSNSQYSSLFQGLGILFHPWISVWFEIKNIRKHFLENIQPKTAIMRRYWLLVFACSVCRRGVFNCTSYPCPAVCTIYGDRHYYTFDGLEYDYVSDCQTYLLKVSHMFSCVLKKKSILNIRSWSIETNVKKTVVEQMWKKNLYMAFCDHLFENGVWVCSCVSLWLREKEKSVFSVLP